MIRARGVHLRYGRLPPAVAGVDLDLCCGERALLTGRSGAGKSTLALALGGLVRPAAGTIRVDGFPAAERSARRAVAARIGFLFQNPETQLLTSRVDEEIALGLRNLGWPPHRIRRRVLALLAALDLGPLAQRPPRALSGGEMQRVALAAALAPEPRYLLLDEPTAHLDPLARAEVEQGIETATGGREVLRLELSPLPFLPGALAGPGSPPRRTIVLENGRVAHDSPGPLSHGLLARLLGTHEPEGPEPLGELAPEPAGVTLRARHLAGGWEGRGRVFRDLDVDLRPGTVTHLAGRSGAGKSTLLLILAGLRPPLEGVIGTEPPGSLRDRVSCVLQFAERLFYRSTVAAELIEYAPAGSPDASAAALARLALDLVGLPAAVLNRSPLRLSAGEVRRLALAAGLLSRRPVLLLDEPEAGLDGPGRRRLRRIVRSFAAAGGTVLIVSHDPELEALADVRWSLAGGQLAAAAAAPAFRSSGGPGREPTRPPSPG